LLQGFLKKAEKHHCLHDSKGGGQPGCSAIDLACKKLVLYDHICITRTIAIDISKDVVQCFDQLIKACMNLSCWQQGADIQYLKLQALMQQESFRYYVKHAQGISTEYNQHSDTDPWYGAGQGTGDSCLCWIA